MKGEVETTAPEVALVLGTRMALGVGLGLLLANRFSEEGQRAVGGTLLLAGTFAAGVFAAELFGRPRPFTLAFGPGRGETRSRGGPGSEERRLVRETVRAGD